MENYLCIGTHTNVYIKGSFRCECDFIGISPLQLYNFAAKRLASGSAFSSRSPTRPATYGPLLNT
jgi:hypothetical protein